MKKYNCIFTFFSVYTPNGDGLHFGHPLLNSCCVCLYRETCRNTETMTCRNIEAYFGWDEIIRLE